MGAAQVTFIVDVADTAVITGATGDPGTSGSNIESDCSDVVPAVFAALIAVTVKVAVDPRVSPVTSAEDKVPTTEILRPDSFSLTT